MTRSVTDAAVEAVAKVLAGDDWDWPEADGREEIRRETTEEAKRAIEAYHAARTLPPASELVRLSVSALWGETICSVGQYVRFDQAEAREADLLRQLEIANRNRDAARENFLTMQQTAENLLRRAEAAEAKLAAQGQDPVAWRWRDSWEGASKVWHYSEKKYDLDDAIFEALYTAPQPDRIAVIEEAAKAAENWSELRDIDWWLKATKKDVSDDACISIAAAIRALKEQSE